MIFLYFISFCVATELKSVTLIGGLIDQIKYRSEIRFEGNQENEIIPEMAKSINLTCFDGR